MKLTQVVIVMKLSTIVYKLLDITLDFSGVTGLLFQAVSALVIITIIKAILKRIKKMGG